MSPSFIHLRVHSEYSLVDGLVKVKPLIKAVGEAGMPAVAITDQNNMCSLVKFYKTATGAGIKPISGVDLWLTDAEDDSDHEIVCNQAVGELRRGNKEVAFELFKRAYAISGGHDKRLNELLVFN